VIRHRIDETRSALTEKLETLEREVRGTVCDAREAVTGTVETVRDTLNSTVFNVRDSVNSTVGTVRETVEDAMCSLKEALNLEHQTQAHPWIMLGGSMAAGYVVGCMLPEPGRKHERATLSHPAYTHQTGEASAWRQPQDSAPAQPGIMSGLMKQFGPEIDKVKGLAIGAALGLVRDLLKQQVPQNFAANVDELINNVTTKLGGEPVHGSVLSSFSSRSERSFAHAGGDREDPGERRFDM